MSKHNPKQHLIPTSTFTNNFPVPLHAPPPWPNPAYLAGQLSYLPATSTVLPSPQAAMQPQQMKQWTGQQVLMPGIFGQQRAPPIQSWLSTGRICGKKACVSNYKFSNSHPCTSSLRIVWWNEGGKIISRIKNNPVLSKLLNRKPDICIYGEARWGTSYLLPWFEIDGYLCYLHKSKPLSVNIFRRGIANFYSENLKCKLSKAYASNNFDIVWMRLQVTKLFIFFFLFPWCATSPPHT